MCILIPSKLFGDVGEHSVCSCCHLERKVIWCQVPSSSILCTSDVNSTKGPPEAACSVPSEGRVSYF